MKKFSYVIVVALAMTTLLSTAALAGKDCSSKTACSEAAKATCSDAKAENAMFKAPGKCCTEAAMAGKGCCGHDAKTVAAAVADYNAGQAALKDMHECCSEAVVAGKGCCGHDATALKADFTQKVAAVKASAKAGCAATCGSKAAASCGSKASSASTKAGCDTKKSCGESKKASLKEHASN